MAAANDILFAGGEAGQEFGQEGRVIREQRGEGGVEGVLILQTIAEGEVAVFCADRRIQGLARLLQALKLGEFLPRAAEGLGEFRIGRLGIFLLAEAFGGLAHLGHLLVDIAREAHRTTEEI